jgi:hypothetical protein
MRRSLWRENGYIVYYNCCWSSPAQSFSVPSPLGLAIIFCSLRLETSSFIASYDSQGYGGGIRVQFPDSYTQNFDILSEWVSYVKTDCQSASLFWNKAPIWGLRPDCYYCQTIAGLLTSGALSDERTGLSFTMHNVQSVYILHVILRYSFTNLI